jgi:hypothetical protein
MSSPRKKFTDRAMMKEAKSKERIADELSTNIPPITNIPQINSTQGMIIAKILIRL